MHRTLYDIMIREYERRLPLPRDTENVAVLEDLAKKITAMRMDGPHGMEEKDLRRRVALISEYYEEATTARRMAAIKRIWKESYGVEFETEWISGLSVDSGGPSHLTCLYVMYVMYVPLTQS
jgi:hypothetical protein